MQPSTLVPLTAEQKEALNAKYGQLNGAGGGPSSSAAPTSVAPVPADGPVGQAPVSYLSAEQKAALNRKYGKIQAPDPKEVLALASDCKMQ